MKMFEKIAREQGWNELKKVAVLLEYIENQASPEAFNDFIVEKQEEENDTDEEYEYDHDGQPDEAQEWHDFDPDC